MTRKAAYKCADMGKVHKVVNLHRGLLSGARAVECSTSSKRMKV